VKNACQNKTELDIFLSLEGNEYIVIHLYTAEIDHQGLIQRPNKEDDYSTELRNIVIEIINEWLENSHKENLFYAIAIEEIESWCLTIFENRDTISIINSKAKLARHLEKNNLTAQKLKCNPNDRISHFQKFLKKKDFHKIKKLREYALKNQSMNDFLKSVENKFDKL
jgi:trans-2-enoyl-CoA reductase